MTKGRSCLVQGICDRDHCQQIILNICVGWAEMKKMLFHLSPKKIKAYSVVTIWCRTFFAEEGLVEPSPVNLSAGKQEGKRCGVKETPLRKWHSPDTQSCRISTLLPVPARQLCFCLFGFQSDLVLFSVSITSQAQGDGSFSPSLSLTVSLAGDLLKCQFSKFKPFQSLYFKATDASNSLKLNRVETTTPTPALDRGQDRPDIESYTCCSIDGHMPARFHSLRGMCHFPMYYINNTVVPE